MDDKIITITFLFIIIFIQKRNCGCTYALWHIGTLKYTWIHIVKLFTVANYITPTYGLKKKYAS